MIQSFSTMVLHKDTYLIVLICNLFYSCIKKVICYFLHGELFIKDNWKIITLHINESMQKDL